MNPTKGPEVLAKAALEILKERKDIYFLFIGPDEGKKDEVIEIVKNEKNIQVLGPIRDKKKIAEMYQAADVFPMPSYREGLPLCCHPDTLIETDQGLKEIKEIKEGDKVLTHRGRFCKVSKIMNRPLKEEIISIKPYGINQEIKLTKEHPVLAIKRPKKNYQQKSLGKLITESNPEWVQSGNLKKGDCVVFPIPKDQFKLDYFDLRKFDSSLNYSSIQVWYKLGYSGKDRRFSYSNLMEITGETKRVIEGSIKYLKNGKIPLKSKRMKKVIRILKEINFKKKDVNKYPRFIKIDRDLAYVFGWYIAEGSSGSSFIRFSMHKKEIKYAKKIKKIIFKKFKVEGKISIEENNRLVLVFCSKILQILFSKLCGNGCRNKRTPREFFNKELLLKLIEGLFLGDGHLNKTGWTLSTTSRHLANDVMLALLMLKKKFHFHKPRRDIFIVNYKPNNKNISHSNKSWFVKDNLCFLIKEIKKIGYSGKVYNLEVEKDHTYTTSGFCIHNCLFEAYASGLPVVASPVNGIPYELKEGENGFLVNYGDVENLKKKILEVLDNEKLAKKFSENNKKKAKNYSWDIIAKRYEDVYKEILRT